MNRKKKITFTGERMIPEINDGATFYYEHLNRYQFAAQFVKGKKVLDLACGSGYGSRMLHAAGTSKVVGVDISKDAISYAENKFGDPGIEFRVGNALDTGLPNKSKDVVVCFEFIEHISAQDKLMQEIKRVLSPGGILVISTPNKMTYADKNKFHKKELNLKEFGRILGRYFKNVEIFGQFFWFSNFIVGKEAETEKKNILPAHELENSQYFIAVCSDNSLGKINTTLVASKSVDGMDVSSGVQPLGKLFSNLSGQISELRKELDEITSSKTYKVWQFYCRMRDKYIK